MQPSFQKTANIDLQRLDAESTRRADKMPLIVVLEDVRSAHNVGSVFRTSDAFLVEEIVLCGITATPPHKEIAKTALGATESVVWHYEADCSLFLREARLKGYSIAAVEQAQPHYWLQNWHQATTQAFPLVLIFGNEVEGVSEAALQHCDYCIEIPQEGSKHSFNVAAAAAMVLWEIYKYYKSAPQS